MINIEKAIKIFKFLKNKMSGEEENNSVTSDHQIPTDIFKNNHDLIGVSGIIEAQKYEIEKKKVRIQQITIIPITF